MARRAGHRRASSLVRQLVLLALVAGTLAAVGGVTPAAASVQQTYHVSPTGSGTSCTVASPCGLSTAQALVQAQTASMTGDLVIQLTGGTYSMGSTWNLGATDGGKHGWNVVYRAAPGAAPVISGGASISGWSRSAPGSSIWKASMPAAFVDFAPRQIYVDGVRASVVSASAKSVFGTITPNDSHTGFSFTAPGPNSWSNVGDADLVYSARGAITGGGYPIPWVYSICPVASISNGTLLQESDCTASIGAPSWQSNEPTLIENSYALLGNPGYFYVDRSAGEIYYVPRPGEDMTSATVMAGLPDTQTLVSINGTQEAPVANLQFVGLTFEFATWQFGNSGVVDHQANMLFNPPTDTVLAPGSLVPAAVACHTCRNVTFEGDTFRHLGGSGLGFDGGGSGNAVIGSVFTDISGNGIQVGESGTFDSNTYLHPPETLESNYTIANNEIYNIATEYLGGVGILGTWVTDTTITHNEIWNTPYSGISLGWGWGRINPTGMSNNRIDYNTIHDVLTSSLEDGGAIYVLGGQDAAGSVRGNYIYNVSRNYAALYLDNGSSNWQVEDNVVAGTAANWLLVQSVVPQAHDNTVTGNYIAATSGGVIDYGNSTNSVTDNSTGLTTWPADAVSIINNAGIQSGYFTRTGSAPRTNLVYGATVYSSSSTSGYPASGASNNLPGTPWASGPGDNSPWWEADLGQAHALSDIQILFRIDGFDQPTTRQNFEIWVSNNADMAQGHEVACKVTSMPLGNQGTYHCAPPSGTWRYVAVVKTDSVQLVLGQVRVFGEPVHTVNAWPDNDLAAGSPATSLSTASGAHGPGNATDGNPNTLFASDVSSANQWWEVDLGQQYGLVQAQIVFRQDGIDQPTTRKNLEIWVSNNADMSLGHTVACSVGELALPHESTFTCPLPSGPWRYVAVMKSDTAELVFSEFRVIGH